MSARAERVGFGLSCDPLVGRLLAVLAAAVPTRGRILELGTGVGVGLAWIVHGLGTRHDVEVISVEIDGVVAEIAQEAIWPSGVRQLIGDAVDFLPTLGEFDLVLADAQGGKWSRLDLTIAAIRPGGILVVDDMDLGRYSEAADRATVAGVGDTLVSHPDLIVAELPASSGIMLATKRHVAPPMTGA